MASWSKTELPVCLLMVGLQGLQGCGRGTEGCHWQEMLLEVAVRKHSQVDDSGCHATNVVDRIAVLPTTRGCC